jgi:hypothetical protein
LCSVQVIKWRSKEVKSHETHRQNLPRDLLA